MRDVYKFIRRTRELLMNISEGKKQCGRKMNQDMGRTLKLLWKEVDKVNGQKVENCKRITERIRRSGRECFVKY